MIVALETQKHSFTDILQNRFSEKFCKIRRKTPVPVFFLIKIIKKEAQSLF